MIGESYSLGESKDIYICALLVTTIVILSLRNLSIYISEALNICGNFPTCPWSPLSPLGTTVLFPLVTHVLTWILTACCESTSYSPYIESTIVKLPFVYLWHRYNINEIESAVSNMWVRATHASGLTKRKKPPI